MALYGLGGLSLDLPGRRLELEAALYGGVSLDSRGGDFGSLLVRMESWSSPRGGTGIGLIAEAYGFSVREPFTYRTGTVRGGPGIRFGGGAMAVEVRGEVGFGGTTVEGRRHSDAELRRATVDLWHVGGRAKATVGGRVLTALATGGVWSSAGGDFGELGLAVVAGSAKVAVRADAALWETPLGHEWVGGLAVMVPLGGDWSVQAVGGQAGPDPLTLVESGGQGGVLLSWRVARLSVEPDRRIHRLVREGGETRVSFRVERADATQVELMGDFTAWVPRSMDRSGSEWTTEIVIGPGTYHYGFLVDGEWYVPEGLPGNVPDEWGRYNATLVVPDVRE